MDTQLEIAQREYHLERIQNDAEYKAACLETAIKDEESFLLWNEGDFCDLDAQYEFVDYGLIMRMLRNLDQACNHKNQDLRNIALDTITTCLSDIQSRMRDAIKYRLDNL